MDEITQDRAPFEPANGVKARWRYAYELVEAKQPGDEITLAELAEALDMQHDPSNREQSRLLFAVMDKAREHLESDYLHTVRTVERFGWVVLDAVGALALVENRTQKMHGAVKRALRGLRSAPREELPASQRPSYDFFAGNLLRASGFAAQRKPDLDEIERESRKRTRIER